MDKTYIISDYSPKLKELITNLKIPEANVISREDFTDEPERKCHDWLTKIFKNNDIERILIPLSLPTDAPVINTDGLLIALHIRLNYEIDVLKRLIPIIFLSNFSVSKIIEKNSFDVDNNPQNLIFTKGIYFSSFDTDEIKTIIERAKPCHKQEYHKNILNKLNIFRKETFGGHDIANAWGCFKLAQVVGIRDKIFELDSISKHLKQLYAKYLICANESFNSERRIDLTPLKCSEKKILFIDDKSDEGWGELMKNIFKGAGKNFVYVDSAKYKNSETKLFHDFEGFLTECRSHIGEDWDLIIIDLRLNPEKEDIDNELIFPTEFSGYKLIDEFLTENEGYQIIVSTASNKIWNINAALERGATSYYVKESPEFNYSISETSRHYEIFKKDVLKSFERSYLREIYKEIKEIKENLDKSTFNASYISELKNQLDLSYTMLKDASKNEIVIRNCPSKEKTKEEKKFAYAYISLYMIIEIINNEFYTKTSDDKWVISGIGNLLGWKWDENLKTYSNSGTEVIGNKPPEWQKFAGIYYQKWNMTDHNFIQQLYFLIKKRNGFVHGDKSILDKQDTSGEYLNHDIFTNDGYEKLFKHIKDLIGYL